VAVVIVHYSGPKLVFWQYVNHQVLYKLAVFVIVKQLSYYRPGQARRASEG
jgi:hypothetical protein